MYEIFMHETDDIITIMRISRTHGKSTVLCTSERWFPNIGEQIGLI